MHPWIANFIFDYFFPFQKFCSQIFVGKLPRDMYEDELIPMFEGFGPIYDFRLMIEPVSGLNKGYGFCTYATKEAALKAVREMDKKEVRGGKKLGICLSLPNDRLFVGSIPKSKTKQQIMEEFSNVTEGLIDVIVYISPEDKKKNRGFAFLQYESHKAASLARRRLMSGKIRVFGNVTPTVDWADPQEEPDDEIMQTVRLSDIMIIINHDYSITLIVFTIIIVTIIIIISIIIFIIIIIIIIIIIMI